MLIRLSVLIILLSCVLSRPVLGEAGQHHASPIRDAWLLGQWELSFDPNDAKKDYIEFRSNGDVFSSGPLGELTGLYLVSKGSVKAVFTYKETDFIMTFFYNQKKDELRIVTSHSGRESIYKKTR